MFLEQRNFVLSSHYYEGGGPGGIRTHDHKIKSLVLYQLSYRPVYAFERY